MSGFSATWLSLRESADHRSRNPVLAAAAAAHGAARVRGGEPLRVIDLGCGTGSNLRALAPRLPHRQHWRLVDHDPGLLQAARAQLADWADAAAEDDSLRLTKGDRELTVTFAQVDLAGDLQSVLTPAPDLVTAAALFDLVSEPWIADFATAVAQGGSLFYTALTYDGREDWSPPHLLDDIIRQAFHAHQGRNKGFGSSAGPAASAALAAAFERLGYRVDLADSPWRLTDQDAALIGELAQGVADAVRETGQVPEPELARWLEARRRASSCMVGHTDCLAVPPL